VEKYDRTGKKPSDFLENAIWDKDSSGAEGDMINEYPRRNTSLMRYRTGSHSSYSADVFKNLITDSVYHSVGSTFELFAFPFYLPWYRFSLFRFSYTVTWMRRDYFQPSYYIGLLSMFDNINKDVMLINTSWLLRAPWLQKNIRVGLLRSMRVLHSRMWSVRWQIVSIITSCLTCASGRQALPDCSNGLVWFFLSNSVASHRRSFKYTVSLPSLLGQRNIAFLYVSVAF
jgi:hypothetical protein